MTTIVELDRRYYPDLIDEHARFDRMIRRYLRPETAALDAGAGRGHRFPHDFRRHVSRMAGVDRDRAVSDNPNLSEAGSPVSSTVRIRMRSSTSCSPSSSPNTSSARLPRCGSSIV